MPCGEIPEVTLPLFSTGKKLAQLCIKVYIFAGVTWLHWKVSQRPWIWQNLAPAVVAPLEHSL